MPRAFYGLVRGPQTYRFVKDYIFNVSGLDGVSGDAYGLLSTAETTSYINAVATQINDTQLKIVIQGDYTVQVEEFNLVNQRTGVIIPIILSGALSLQDASFLGQYDANMNIGKQITVLNDYEFNEVNVTFASVDYSGDGVYNWVRIGNFINGVDGRSIYAIVKNSMKYTIENLVKEDDIIIIGEDVSYDGQKFKTGDIWQIGSLRPLSFLGKGNVRGATGPTGATGARGNDGIDGITPEIIEGYWHIGEVNTGVRAIGIDGTDGVDGKTFAIQSGLYSVPANVGQPGNTDAEGNALQTLPLLPQLDITGKGYIVYDPITTPLQPYYDLYYANNGDNTWTIIHPFNGINGRNGTDGATPYIQNNNWYINGNNTGVPATGPQGPKGDKGVNYMGEWVQENEYYEDDLVTYQGSSYICIQDHSNSSTAPSSDASNWHLFASKGDTGSTGPTGATGATGAVPNISVSAEELPAGSQPTATRSGTNENPIITFGIPAAGAGGGGGLKSEVISVTGANYYKKLYNLMVEGKLLKLTIRPKLNGAPINKYTWTINSTGAVVTTSTDSNILMGKYFTLYPSEIERSNGLSFVGSMSSDKFVTYWVTSSGAGNLTEKYIGITSSSLSFYQLAYNSVYANNMYEITIYYYE